MITPKQELVMVNHSFEFEEEKESVPEIYDQELGAAPELPVRLKVTAYAVLVAISFILLILKQMGQIDWSWWWISLPIWLLPAGFVLIALVILLLTIWHKLKRAIR